MYTHSVTGAVYRQATLNTLVNDAHNKQQEPRNILNWCYAVGALKFIEEFKRLSERIAVTFNNCDFL